MPETIISNAAHTSLRRNALKELGLFISGHRVPGTTFWRIYLSHETLDDLLSWSRKGESLSSTIVRIFAIYEQSRKHHASTTSTTH